MRYLSNPYFIHENGTKLSVGDCYTVDSYILFKVLEINHYLEQIIYIRSDAVFDKTDPFKYCYALSFYGLNRLNIIKI